MTGPGHTENQQELFHEFSSEAKKGERFPALQKTQKPILINTSTEQIILLTILLILLCCAIFFLGMVRGRLIGTGMRTSPLAPNLPRPVVVAPAVETSRAVPHPEAPDINKPYTIQLVTFKKQVWAEQEALALRKKGYFATILTSGDYYLVCVGQYANIDEAKRDRKIFSARYKDCFLRRR